jgi:hypothetical protein
MRPTATRQNPRQFGMNSWFSGRYHYFRVWRNTNVWVHLYVETGKNRGSAVERLFSEGV